MFKSNILTHTIAKSGKKLLIEETVYEFDPFLWNNIKSYLFGNLFDDDHLYFSKCQCGSTEGLKVVPFVDFKHHSQKQIYQDVEGYAHYDKKNDFKLLLDTRYCSDCYNNCRYWESALICAIRTEIAAEKLSKCKSKNPEYRRKIHNKAFWNLHENGIKMSSLNEKFLVSMWNKFIISMKESQNQSLLFVQEIVKNHNSKLNNDNCKSL
jgi:hypothetical protein